MPVLILSIGYFYIIYSQPEAPGMYASEAQSHLAEASFAPANTLLYETSQKHSRQGIGQSIGID